METKKILKNPAMLAAGFSAMAIPASAYVYLNGANDSPPCYVYLESSQTDYEGSYATPGDLQWVLDSGCASVEIGCSGWYGVWMESGYAKCC